jgi:23S rRNA pseudouridine1911/1915/1917 synthase
VVETAPAVDAGILEHFLVKDATHNRVRVAAPDEPGARWARLHYRVLRPVAAGTLVEVQLETGRAHQIRVQLAAAGCVLAGDLRYGSRRALGSMIALHAHAIDFAHPTRGDRIRIEAPIPPAWHALLDG